MRFPVSFKLVLALSALVVFGLVVLALSYRALADVRSEVDRLARHRHPLTEATHELETSINNFAMTVLAYVESARPSYRDAIDKGTQDIDRYVQIYSSLANLPREQKLGKALSRQVQAYLGHAGTLLDKRDAITTTLDKLAECAEDVDAMVHAWIKRTDALPASRRDHAAASARAALTVEADVAEVGLALMWSPFSSAQTRHRRYLLKLGEFESAVSRLQRLPLDASERRAVVQLAAEEREIASLVKRLIELEDGVETSRQLFIDQQQEIDRLLEEEIQTLAHHGFEIPMRAVDQLTQTALRQLSMIIFPLFAACALLLGVLMYRSVTRPMLALKKGMRTVAQGDRVEPITGMPNDEFGDLAGEFNRMTRLLRERSDELAGKDTELRRRETMASMGSLVSGVAHEVRNPLFGITSTLDALQARLHGQPEQSRHIAVLRGETSRLQKLMQDLLDYGKPASNERSATNLFSLIERALAECMPLAHDRGVRLDSDLHGAAPVLELDTQRMDQVFVNLIENALQHSEPGSTILVSARRDDALDSAAVVCSVADQGSGFRPEDLHRVFEPFFTRRRGGTGLGLSIVQRIVEEHGGSIDAANRLEGGAVMTLRLPVPIPVAASAEPAAGRANDPANASAQYSAAEPGPATR
jgi:signal transduction histidine kinase